LEYPEDSGRNLLWNVCTYVPVWTATCPRRLEYGRECALCVVIMLR
jgi:hypothetical protein